MELFDLIVWKDPDIQIHFFRNAIYRSAGSVLPKLEIIVEIGLVFVLGEPEIIIHDLAEVIFQIAALGVEIDHRCIPRLSDPLTEGVGCGAKGQVFLFSMLPSNWYHLQNLWLQSQQS